MDHYGIDKFRSKRKKEREHENSKGAYGVVKPSKYYFPGKVTSGCFDENGRREESRRTDSSDDMYGCFHEKEYDPLGMYTGVPIDEFDVPIQDADDL